VDIRSVLGKVAEIMIREAPHLFGDFTALPLPDGTAQWQPAHSKVWVGRLKSDGYSSAIVIPNAFKNESI